ncbi:MAG: hypothetical protein J0665_20025 [Deltaproteobacteria bacterium]|nr:hypothetical protein [Deltaproteobacteria bacterium]
MELINIFHEMEIDEKLFYIGDDIGLPVWDIIRYNVYVRYYYPKKERDIYSSNSKLLFSDYGILIPDTINFMLKMFLVKGDNIVLTNSRYYNLNRKRYDKNALPIISELGNNCLILESIIGRKYAYKCLYDSYLFFRKIRCSVMLPYAYYVKVEQALEKYLKVNLFSYSEANKIYNNFISDFKYYNFIFKSKKTKKVFIATGNPKAIILAAKRNNVKTFLLQHAMIEFDCVEYSFPEEISLNDNILFSDYLLVFGKNWCKGINVPVKKILSIGQNMSCGMLSVISDNSVLIISTIIHGGELKILTKELSVLLPQIKFVYKLHPNEYKLYDDYVSYFKDNNNVSVLTDQVSIDKLIALSQLVILIISSVLYEALSQNKKVAVYKKLNYSKLFRSGEYKNLYSFDSAYEVKQIISEPYFVDEIDFYQPLNYNLIRELCKNNFN